RLVRSTKDVEEAQKLLNLALDLSAATGKPLETVTNALGRAYDGNTTALGKLGLGLDADIIKSKDFDAIFAQLTGTFGNFAENESQSTAKQLERVKIALDEAKESIGAALLPVVQKLTAWLLDNFIPALEAFIEGLTGNDGLNDSLTKSQKTAVEWGKKLRGFIDTVIDLKDELIALGTILGSIFLASKVVAGIQALAGAIGLLTTAFNAQKTAAAGAAVATAYATGGGSVLAATAALAAIGGAAFLYGKLKDAGDSERAKKTGPLGNFSMSTDSATDRSKGISSNAIGSSSGGGLSGGSGVKPASTSAPTQTLIEQVTEANFLKNMPKNGFDVAAARRGEEKDRVVININGAVDPTGTARQIATILNTEASTSGSFTNLGASRFA
ncbi:MAG: hypothetical protein ACO3E4_07800, partial [Candidatus Nanopelagicaceae bacterium]